MCLPTGFSGHCFMLVNCILSFFSSMSYILVKVAFYIKLNLKSRQGAWFPLSKVSDLTLVDRENRRWVSFAPLSGLKPSSTWIKPRVYTKKKNHQLDIKFVLNQNYYRICSFKHYNYW